MGLDWREIAVDPPDEFPELTESPAIKIDVLVKKVRSQRREKIQNQCGTLQLLDTNRPVNIENIYIDVNILQEIASQQWLDISNLQNPSVEEFDRFGLGQISRTQISGTDAVETYSKLKVLDKPGCGKTTFLQHLAIQCNQGNREIFLLTTAMLRSADSLVHLMKQQIDGLVAQDLYLQEFLTWASKKSLIVPQPTLTATRAFYLGLTQIPTIAPHFALVCTLDQGIFLDTLLNNLMLECAMESSSDFTHAYACADALSNALTIVLDVGLQQSLQQLKDSLPNQDGDRAIFQSWWQINHQAWNERLQTAIALHRHIQSDWHFSRTQQQILERYYDANKLLIDCLNSNCEVTTAVRKEIENALLLPQTKLEAREWN